MRLVLIGPEKQICDGWADRLARDGLAVFAPSGEASRLESSKAFAKEFMVRNGIPTAEFRAFGGLAEAERFLSR